MSTQSNNFLKTLIITTVVYGLLTAVQDMFFGTETKPARIMIESVVFGLVISSILRFVSQPYRTQLINKLIQIF